MARGGEKAFLVEAEGGIGGAPESRGLGDMYEKRLEDG